MGKAQKTEDAKLAKALAAARKKAMKKKQAAAAKKENRRVFKFITNRGDEMEATMYNCSLRHPASKIATLVEKKFEEKFGERVKLESFSSSSSSSSPKVLAEGLTMQELCEELDLPLDSAAGEEIKVFWWHEAVVRFKFGQPVPWEPDAYETVFDCKGTTRVSKVVEVLENKMFPNMLLVGFFSSAAASSAAASSVAVTTSEIGERTMQELCQALGQQPLDDAAAGGPVKISYRLAYNPAAYGKVFIGMKRYSFLKNMTLQMVAESFEKRRAMQPGTVAELRLMNGTRLDMAATLAELIGQNAPHDVYLSAHRAGGDMIIHR